MQTLFEIQSILLNQHQPIYQRKVFTTFRFDNPINCIVGARGVGKTTFLIDLVDTLHKETDVRLLCIDEIHKQAHWKQQIKNIADTYQNIKIIFTGSSQADLLQSRYDLSRRVIVYHLHGLSFREYLEMHYNREFPVLTLEEMTKNSHDISAKLQLPQAIKAFHDYLRVGYYPFFGLLRDETEKYQAIRNITQKVIYEDIAMLHSLKTGTLVTIENLYKFILGSAPGELNAYKLSSNLKKDFDSISNYLVYLRDAGLIRFLCSNKSLRNPAKMYPENSSLLYSAYLNVAEDNLIGKARETFALNQFQNAGLEVFFTEHGDFECQEMLLEIGDKNKSATALKGFDNGWVFADGILAGFGKKLPLYWLGFLS